MDSLTPLFSGIRAFIFDVDGVLSPDSTPLDENGDPVRNANVKDGFAIRAAIGKGYTVGIITGGCQVRVKLRYRKLGVHFYYDNIRNKTIGLDDFINKTGIAPSEILYMGDDIIDYEVMQRVGLPVCPQDAVEEIKGIARYISSCKGGEGCVRDVIEKVLKARGQWIIGDFFHQQSN